jgi:hypothetical protein
MPDWQPVVPFPYTPHSSESCEDRSVWVAQAIAEGKVKVTVAELDRLIRLEEFLREEQKAESRGGL